MTRRVELGLALLAALTTLVVLNHAFLFMPPVWDAVGGVFAPAIELYEREFDLPSLLAQPGYVGGGPNTHVLSTVTALTYGAIAVSGGRPELYLPALHALQLAFAAGMVACVYALGRESLGRRLAALTALLLLATPLFLVQAGYLYMELPGAAATLLALGAWSQRRWAWMGVGLVLACATKSFGLVLACALVVLLLLDGQLPRGRRARWIALVVGVSGGLEALRLLASPPPMDLLQEAPPPLARILGNLLYVPDVLGLILLSLVFPLLRSRALGLRGGLSAIRRRVAGPSRERLWLAMVVFTFGFIAFLVAAPLVGLSLAPLPRYSVWILGPMLLMLARVAMSVGEGLGDARSRRPAAAAALSALVIVQWLNHEGRLYPFQGTGPLGFSIVERSWEYRELYELQAAAARAVEAHAAGRPVITTRGEYFALSSPLMGYVSRPVQDARFVLAEPYRSARLEDYPLEFLLLDVHSHGYHGQDVLRTVLAEANDRSDYAVTQVASGSVAEYGFELLRVVKERE